MFIGATLTSIDEVSREVVMKEGRSSFTKLDIPSRADRHHSEPHEEPIGNEIDRKEFLKVAGITGAALAVSAFGGARAGFASTPRTAAAGVGFTAGDPLMPTGDPDIDTSNIQTAIHDTQMDTGGTLYLGPGVFRIDASMARQAFSPASVGYNTTPFNGTIQGAGKEKTFIRSVRHPGGDEFTKFYDALFDVYYGCTLWITDHDYLGVRDLTFEADNAIADPWTLWGYRLSTSNLVYMTAGSNFPWEGTPYGTDIVNVDLKGPRDAGGLAEMPAHLAFWGGGGGTHNLKGCRFESSFAYTAWYFGLGDSTLNIGGIPKEKVVFENAGDIGAGLYLDSFSNTTANVSRNYLNDVGIVAFGGGPESSTLNLDNNVIRNSVASWFPGLEMWGPTNLAGFVTKNDLHKNGSPTALFFGSVDNAVVAQNKFTGDTEYGGIGLLECNGCMVLGNNVQGVNASLTAPITLLDSAGCTIVGHAKDCAAVLPDIGDNILVGVNNVGNTVGPEVSKAMRAVRDARQQSLQLNSIEFARRVK